MLVSHTRFSSDVIAGHRASTDHTVARRWFPRYTTCILVAAVFWVLPPASLAQSLADIVVQDAMHTFVVPSEYWTAQRMRNARPMPLRRLSGPRMDKSTMRSHHPTGPMVIASSGAPGDKPTEVRQASLADAPESEPKAGTFPFAYTSYQLFPDHDVVYRQYPYRAIGKVFFTIPGEGDFVCSGSVVNSPNQSMVWTAGHCVYTLGVGFHTNFVFAPARRSGVNLLDVWTANTLGTTAEWMSSELLEYDHGAAFMNPGGPGGTHSVAELGFLGFLANASRRQHFHATGYPAAAPFTGEKQHTCAAAWATDDLPTGTMGVDPPTIGMGCDMTGGSSGGPWIVDLGGVAGPGTNLLNGNVSYGYIGVPEQQYGPYFSDAAIALRDAIGTMTGP